jgi:hypothetical protein
MRPYRVVATKQCYILVVVLSFDLFSSVFLDELVALIFSLVVIQFVML